MSKPSRQLTVTYAFLCGCRIAFKLVWCPGLQQDFRQFVLVDDDGGMLASGTPTGRLPTLDQRAANWDVVDGSKFSQACVTDLPRTAGSH